MEEALEEALDMQESTGDCEETAARVPTRQHLSIPEVARARGVSRVAVHYAIRQGKLRAWRPPGRRDWLIPVEDARAYVARPIRSRD